MERLGTLGRCLVAQVSMLVLVQVVDVEATFTRHRSKYGSRVGRPGNVTNSISQVERFNWALHASDPKLDRPVS